MKTSEQIESEVARIGADGQGGISVQDVEGEAGLVEFNDGHVCQRYRAPELLAILKTLRTDLAEAFEDDAFPGGETAERKAYEAFWDACRPAEWKEASAGDADRVFDEDGRLIPEEIRLTTKDLPDGQTWVANAAGHAAAWKCWQALVRHALPRNEGVKVTLAKDGNSVTMETTRAPLDETEMVTIGWDGEVCWHGEQHAHMEAP